MFGLFGNGNNYSAKLEALGKSFAVIEFDPQGNILDANANFLAVMGYEAAEVIGKHHSMFLEPKYRDSNDYRVFWDRLRAGQFDRAQYKRLGKGGREIWIEASYNPIKNARGDVVSVVKYALDVTGQRQEHTDLSCKVTAMDKSQAVIEFTLDGIIVDANANFLNAMGYTLAEVKGRHHSMFAEPAFAKSREYQEFWDTLRSGQFLAAQYKRIAKGGREVWIEASYNPILDLNGKPYKVIKYATDITKQMDLLRDLNRLIDVNFSEIDMALDKSNQRTSNAANAAMSTSGSIQTIAASAEELAASVNEIASSMARSKQATEEAAAQSSTANEATKRLSDAATAMGGIVALIQNIAGQINLLALNATIESARAGEAGRGFAVVANEVKSLANQAAKATEQISQEINGIQSISNDVVSSLGAIRNALDVMRDTVLASASAVEEQSVVTGGMSSSMQQAAGAVGNITEDMTGIAAAFEQVSGLVRKTKEAAVVLAR